MVLLWISLPQLPGGSSLANLPVLLPFRYLLRALVVGSFALLVLAWLWDRYSLEAAAASPARQTRRLAGRSCAATWPRWGSLCWVGLMFLGVLDLYSTHRPYVKSQPDNRAVYRLASWLRQNVPGDSYVRVNPNNVWYEAVLSNRLRLIEPWYPLGELHQFANDPAQRPVRAQPNYLIQPSDQPLPITRRLPRSYNRRATACTTCRTACPMFSRSVRRSSTRAARLAICLEKMSSRRPG